MLSTIKTATVCVCPRKFTKDTLPVGFCSIQSLVEANCLWRWFYNSTCIFWNVVTDQSPFDSQRLEHRITNFYDFWANKIGAADGLSRGRKVHPTSRSHHPKWRDLTLLALYYYSTLSSTPPVPKSTVGVAYCSDGLHDCSDARMGIRHTKGLVCRQEAAVFHPENYLGNYRGDSPPGI